MLLSTMTYLEGNNYIVVGIDGKMDILSSARSDISITSLIALRK